MILITHVWEKMSTFAENLRNVLGHEIQIITITHICILFCL